LGYFPPSVGVNTFDGVDECKPVIVKLNANRTQYGSDPDLIDTTSQNWGNAFRGMGTDYLSTVNTNIDLKIIGN